MSDGGVFERFGGFKKYTVFFLLVFSLLSARAVPLDTASGESLARAIRSAEPEENSVITGTLIIHSNKEVTNVPVTCRVMVNGPTWQTEYETSSAGAIPAEQLIVVHSTNGPNEYLFSSAKAAGEAPPTPAPVPVADADMPLAGSDFSLADLGLQFLHWPRQERLRDQDRLGQACYVLESSRPGDRGVVRVKSYIDQQTGGILLAEAYDEQGREVKVFSLHGSSFKKINGHWHLQKMEISNRLTRSRTELKFNLDSMK